MAGRDAEKFDWIDDAFDDKKTAEDIEKAKGPVAAMVLLVVALIGAALLVMFALIAIPGAYSG